MKNITLAFLALITAACGSTHGMTNHDKNTNWLMSCSDAQACGDGLVCVCGVCTTPCEEASQCSALGASAVCETLAAGGNACSGRERTETVCTLSCEQDSMCSELNEDLSCVSDRCVPEAGRQGSPDGGPRDSGLPPDMDASVIVDSGPVQVDGSIRDGGPIQVPDGSGPMPDGSVDGGEGELVCGEGFQCDEVASGMGIVVDLEGGGDGYMYWADWGSMDALENHQGDGAIKRVSKSGGEIETVFGELLGPLRVWLDAERYYWLTGLRHHYANGTAMQDLYEAFRDPSAHADAGVDPERLETRTFSRSMEIVAEAAVWWQDGGLNLYRWPLHAQPAAEPSSIAISMGTVVGLEAEGDALTVYVLGQGGTSLTGRTSTMQTELLSDPPVRAAALDGDTFWLIHTSASGARWLSSMPKAGGSITHLASITRGRVEGPRVGASTLWLVGRNSASTRDTLYHARKSGGEVAIAMRWDVLDAQEETLWFVEGDETWVVFADRLYRVTASD